MTSATSSGSDRAVAIVGNQKRIRARGSSDFSFRSRNGRSFVFAAGPPESSRTICWRCECTAPARMRIFVGVRYDFVTRIPPVSIPSFLKVFDQLAVLPHRRQESDGQRFCAESAQIVNGIGAASRNDLCFAMIQNQHRSFSRDSRDFAVNENVRDEIAENDNALAFEFSQQFLKPVHFDQSVQNGFHGVQQIVCDEVRLICGSLSELFHFV